MRLRRRHTSPPWVRLLLLIGVLLFTVRLVSCGKSDNKSASAGSQTATMKEMFETALEPMGSTMYVWGGGWDSENECAGRSARQLGVSSKWEEFAGNQDAGYDFKEHRYESENGLDCSGYVGWVMYNLFEDRDGKEGYVTFSTKMAEDFAGRGWGKLIKNPHEFLPGDIVSMEGHIWISLGTCEDGSVLLMHSSPPGVSVCGTVIPCAEAVEEGEAIDGGVSTDSIAVRLATEYMSENYPDWQEKYPNRTVPETYLENVTVLRWNNQTLKDAKEYQSLSGEAVIDLL